MKLMKEMKKLKFWSSKKRKKKDNYYYYYKQTQYDFYPYVYHPSPPSPPPPPLPLPEGCQCHFCLPAKPSAPPLPAWLEPQLQRGISGDSNSFLNSSEEHESGDHCIRISQEIVVKTASTCITTAAATSSTQLQGKTEIIDSSSSALQQCLPSREKDAAGALQQWSPSREKDAAGALQQWSPSREKDAAGLLGCVVDVGALLFRCFHSCLRISERHYRPYHYKSSSLPHKALAYQNMEKKRY